MVLPVKSAYKMKALSQPAGAGARVTNAWKPCLRKSSLTTSFYCKSQPGPSSSLTAALFPPAHLQVKGIARPSPGEEQVR